MKHYYISHTSKKTKEKNVALYNEIQSKGEHINSGWSGDYYVSIYKYKGKTFELWDN